VAAVLKTNDQNLGGYRWNAEAGKVVRIAFSGIDSLKSIT
jgi:hypothetical protein